MSITYTNQDYTELAKLFEKHDDTPTPQAWCDFMREWIEEFNSTDLIELIINCFFVAYGPVLIDKHELKEVICTTPFELLSQFTTNVSIENPKGIIATWRLSINK